MKVSKDVLVLKQDMALAYDLPFFVAGGGESLTARLLRKSLDSFPIRPFVPKNQGVKEPISTSITLCC